MQLWFPRFQPWTPDEKVVNFGASTIHLEVSKASSKHPLEKQNWSSETGRSSTSRQQAIGLSRWSTNADRVKYNISGKGTWVSQLMVWYKRFILPFLLPVWYIIGHGNHGFFYDGTSLWWNFTKPRSLESLMLSCQKWLVFVPQEYLFYARQRK
jgi:hypothetical protein